MRLWCVPAGVRALQCGHAVDIKQKRIHRHGHRARAQQQAAARAAAEEAARAKAEVAGLKAAAEEAMSRESMLAERVYELQCQLHAEAQSHADTAARLADSEANAAALSARLSAAESRASHLTGRNAELRGLQRAIATELQVSESVAGALRKKHDALVDRYSAPGQAKVLRALVSAYDKLPRGADL